MNVEVVNELDYDYKYTKGGNVITMVCFAFQKWWKFYGKTEEDAWDNAYNTLDKLYPEED